MKTVFYARTLGKKYEIVVRENEYNLFDCQELVNGEIVGESCNYTRSGMMQRVQQILEWDNIRYIIQNNELFHSQEVTA